MKTRIFNITRAIWAVSAMALATASSGLAQSDTSGSLTHANGRPGSRVILLGVHSIQKELGLSPRQVSAVDALRKQYRESARGIVRAVGTGAETKRDGQLRLDALTGLYNKKANEVLTQQQRGRLAEVEHQVLGGYLLMSEPLQDVLELTDRQKHRIRGIYEDAQADISQVNALYERGKLSNHERLLELREHRIQTADRMLKVLDAHQRKMFEDLGGEPFNA